MGLYVNPVLCTKEQWLATHATTTTQNPELWLQGYNSSRTKNQIPVVLVDNGPFTALAVAYDQREAAAFAREDGRSKIFATVPRDSLADAGSGVGENLLSAYKL